MAKDAVEIFLLLQNVRKFIEQAGQAAHAVTGIGTAAETSGKKAKSGWKSMAKWAAGGAALAAGTKFAKDAVSETTNLAKSTLQLQRVTGMETTTASEWVGVLKQRHVSTQTFGRTLSSLSKQMEQARTGTNTQTTTMRKLRREYEAVSAVGGKKAPAALAKIQRQMDSARKKGDSARKTFANLGVSLDAIRKGNTQDVIMQIADRFKTMTNPAQRAAAAQKLFGRSWQPLLSLLMSGRKGIEENLNMQEKYGNVLHGKSIEETRELIHKQHEMEAAMSGVKVTLGTALLPVILAVVDAIVKLVAVFQPIIRRKDVMLGIIIALTAAFMAYKIALVVSTIASLGFEAATWGWIGAILLVVVLLVAIGIGVYKLYKRWGWFHDMVNKVWAAIKTGAKAAWDFLKPFFQWLQDNWKTILRVVFTPWRLELKAIVKLVKLLIDLFKKVWDIGKGVVGKIGGAIGGAKKLGGKVWPFADGGTMPQTGTALVGERGPEIVNMPRGARITPVPVGQLDAGGIFTAHVTTQLVVDRRVLAQAVASYSADKLARR